MNLWSSSKTQLGPTCCLLPGTLMSENQMCSWRNAYKTKWQLLWLAKTNAYQKSGICTSKFSFLLPLHSMWQVQMKPAWKCSPVKVLYQSENITTDIQTGVPLLHRSANNSLGCCLNKCINMNVQITNENQQNAQMINIFSICSTYIFWSCLTIISMHCYRVSNAFVQGVIVDKYILHNPIIVWYVDN